MSSPYVAGAAIESMVGLVISRTPSSANLATVSFASEVAHHPASAWVSIAHGSLTHDLLRENGDFTYVVLHDRQADIAWRCGTSSGRTVDKAAGLPLYMHAGRFMFLRSGMTNLACRIRRSVDVGDHTLFVADVLSGEVNSRFQYRRHLLVRDLLQC
jgi:flavin reductase (DIM6/NTAB) family NADH-FMN oxidoreductase RutF